MKTTTIKRSLWYRGKGAAISRLLITSGEYKGMMCCLGFDALECGLSEDEIGGRASACTVQWAFNKEKWWIDDSLMREMINVNDNPNISDEEREKQLKELAPKALGRRFKFVD